MMKKNVEQIATASAELTRDNAPQSARDTPSPAGGPTAATSVDRAVSEAELEAPRTLTAVTLITAVGNYQVPVDPMDDLQCDSCQ